MVSIICLASGAVLDTVTGPCRGKGSVEQSLLRTMLDTLEADDILLGDAFYATYFLLGALQAKGVYGVFEQYGARRLALILVVASVWGATITLSNSESQRRNRIG